MKTVAVTESSLGMQTSQTGENLSRVNTHAREIAADAIGCVESYGDRVGWNALVSYKKLAPRPTASCATLTLRSGHGSVTEVSALKPSRDRVKLNLAVQMILFELPV